MKPCNYDADATTDDGSCDLTSCVGCTDAEACNYNPEATVDDGSCVMPDPVDGCTDTCDFPVSVKTHWVKGRLVPLWNSEPTAH